MKQLRTKIKAIIFNEQGLPGLDRQEYMAAMRKILKKKLSKKEQQMLVDDGIFMGAIITELSNELAEEFL